MTRPTNKRDVLTLIASRPMTRSEVYEALGREVSRIQVGTLLWRLEREKLARVELVPNPRRGRGQPAKVQRYRWAGAA